MTERRQMGIKYEITDKVMTPVGSIQSRFTIDFLSKKKRLEISREYPTSWPTVQTNNERKHKDDVVPVESSFSLLMLFLFD